MEDLDQLLHGAIDMHVHTNPDTSLDHPQHKSNRQVIDECRQAGMAGFVLKSHGWPCVGLGLQLNEDYEDFTVFPSVSLNVMAGGPRPWVVEMAAAMGTKMVFLPTWSAASDQGCEGGYGVVARKYVPRTIHGFRPEDCYDLLDDEGRLLEDIKECIQLCKESDMVMGTGHISARESLEVGKFAKEIGYRRLCLTHPRAGCSFHEFEQIRTFAELGHYVEITALGLAPLHGVMTIGDVKRIIEDVGADHCYISSDHFFDWTPAIPQQFYQILGCLREIGVSYDVLKILMHTPRHILGLD